MGLSEQAVKKITSTRHWKAGKDKYYRWLKTQKKSPVAAVLRKECGV